MAWTSTNANTRLALGQTSTLKTINGISLLGDGDITVATSAAGSGNEVQYRANDGTFAAALGSSVDTLGVATLSGLKLASGTYPTYLDTQYIPTYNFLALTRNGNNVGLRVAEFYSSTGSTNKVMAHPAYGLRIASDRALEFSSTSEVTGSADAKITRATGPYIKVQADSGFSVRNLADTQYASGTALAWYGSDYVQGATRVLVGNSSGGRLLPGTDGLQVYNWAQSGLGYLQAGSFYVGGTAGSGDVLIARNATGPAAQIQAAGGLNIKNFAGTAPGALDVGNITSYNSTYPSGTISTRLPDGTGVFSGGGTFGTGFSATKSQAIEFKNHAGTSKFGMGIDDSDGFYISGPSKNKAMVMHPTYGIGLISDGQVFTTCSSFSVFDASWNNYALAYLGRLRLNTGDFNTTGTYSLSASEIWSNAAVTFSSNIFAVTDSGSLAGSKLVDFRSDNVSRVSINKVASAANHTAPFRLTFADTVSLAYSPEYGKLTLRNAANTADASLYLSSIQATSDVNVTSYISVSGHSEMGSSSWRGAGRAMTVASGGGYHFSSTTSVGGTADVGFYRNAAGVVEVNSGTINAYRDMKLRSLITTGGTLPSSGGMGTDGLAIGLSGLTTYGIGANGNAEPVIVTNSVHTATLGRNIKIPSDGSYGFTGVTNANQNSSTDVLLTRSATGPALQVQSAGGLNVKNLAGTSDAGIVASSIASSSGTFTVNAAATSVQLNVAGTNHFSVQSGANYSINNLLPFGTYDLGNSTGNAWRSLYLDSTVTTSTPAINLAQTWNGTGVTFTGIKSNITDTLSANGSLLLDLQVGSVSKFSVDKYGNATVNNLTVNGTSNITATPGGSSGQLQYNNSGVFGGISGSAVSGSDVTFGGNVLALGSLNLGNTSVGIANILDNIIAISPNGLVVFDGSYVPKPVSASQFSTNVTPTSNAPSLYAVQTWNNVAVPFTLMYGNVTDTASASTSNLIDLQVGATSKFKVDKSGNQTLSGNLSIGTSGQIKFGSSSLYPMLRRTGLGIEARRQDDGGYSDIYAENVLANNALQATSYIQMGSSSGARFVQGTDGVNLLDFAGSALGYFHSKDSRLGGSTGSPNGLLRSTVSGTVEVRNGSDSAAGNISAAAGTFTGAVTVGNTSVSSMVLGNASIAQVGGNVFIASGSGASINLMPSGTTRFSVDSASCTIQPPLTVQNSVTITAGTATTSTPVINATQTWNSGATTFKAITLDVTDTTSASASKFLDFSLGGTSKFSVDKNGNVSLNNLTVNGTHNITMTATPGGTSGQIQYNNGGSLGGMSGSTISGSNMTLTGTFGATSATLTGGTITTSTPAVTATQTWNNVATTFTGISLDVTDTASASGSKLLDLMVGSSTKFSVDKAGNTVTGNQLTLTPSDTFGTTRITAGNYGTLSLGLNGGYLAVAGTSSLLYTASQFSPVNTGTIDLGQTGTRFKNAYFTGPIATSDNGSASIDAPSGTINGYAMVFTNRLRANSGTNFEVLASSGDLKTVGGIGFHATAATSGFTAKSVLSSTAWQIQADGGLTVKNLAGSADAALTALTGTFSGGTATTSTPAVSVSQTWNNVATTFTGITSNITDTASAAASKLIDLQVGGTSKFAVKKDGSITVATGSTLSADVISCGSLVASTYLSSFQLLLSDNVRIRNTPTSVDGDVSVLKMDVTTLGNVRTGVLTLGNPATAAASTDWAKIKAIATGAIALRNAADSGYASMTAASTFVGSDVTDYGYTSQVFGRMSLADNTTLRNVFLNGGNGTVTGSDNLILSSFGSASGTSLTSGSFNTAVGNRYAGGVGGSLTSGSDNSFFGSGAGYGVGTGDDNVMMGYLSGYNSLTADSNNTYVGAFAGYGGNGSSNVYIGNKAGRAVTGSNNIHIGIGATSTITESNKLRIGPVAAPIIDGNLSTNAININGAATFSSTGTFSGQVQTTTRFNASVGASVQPFLTVTNSYGGIGLSGGGASTLYVTNEANSAAGQLNAGNLIAQDYVQATSRLLLGSSSGGRLTPITDGVRVQNWAQSADGAIQAASIGSSSVSSNFRISVPTYGAGANYGEIYFNNVNAGYDSYLFFNAVAPMTGGNNNFGIQYRGNNQANFGLVATGNAYINFQPSAAQLVGTWTFPANASYQSPRLASTNGSGGDVGWWIGKSGNGVGATITGYTYCYATTGVPPLLDFRAKSIQLGAYTDPTSTHAWNDTNITNKIIIDASGLTVTGNVLTATHNTYDIGTTGTRFKDAYLQGNVTTAGSVIATNYLVGSSTGPMIKNNSGSVRLRDYLDSTYAGLEAGTGTFSGSVTAGTFTAVNGSTGRVMVVTGDATYSGYIEWRNPANSPKWYMGYDSGNDITLAPFASGSVNIGTATYTGSVKLIGSASNATISVSTGSTLNTDKPLSVTGGTVTTSIPVFDSTQTWNNVATTFTAIKADVTDTASASGSLLLDLQVGGASKASINKLGAMTLASTLTVGNSTFASVNLGGSASLNQVFGSTVFTGTAVSLSPGGVARLSASSTSVDVTTPMTQSIGTVTSTTPAISVTGTWNNVATSFTGLKFDFTDTASASTSKLLDLQVGSVTKFSVDKAGNTVLNNLTVNGTHNITANAGGSSGQLQYNNAGALGGISSSSVSGANLTLGGTLGFTTATATGGTVTSSTPLFTGTQTWNSAGQTFKAIHANITDTASGSGSLLLDLQVGGTSYLSATKAGLVTAPTFSASAASTGYLNICKGDGSNSGYIEWRNQTNTRKWYMGYDSTNDLTLMPESSGSLKIGSATYTGSVKLVGSASTATVAVTTGSSVSVDKDVAITGAVSATYATLATGSISSSTPAVNVTQTWNNVATTFTGIKANITDTTSASASLLMDLQVGSVSKFNVDKSGTATAAVFYSGAGSLGVPGIMIGEASTGFYRNVASTLRMTLGGTVSHGWNTSGFETTGYIGFTTASPGSAIHDALIARNSTGPTIDVRAAGGLKVRNFAGTNDAPLTASAGTFSSTIAVSDTSTTADRFTFKDDGATTWTLSTGGVASTDGFRFTKLGVADIVAFRPSVCVHYTPLTTTGLLTATSGLFAKSDTTWADANIPTVTVQNTATSGSRTAVIKAKIDTGYTGALPELWMGAETATSGITGTFVRTVSNHPMIFYTNDVKRFELTAAGHIVPSTTNVTDLGLTGTRFKDAYLQGTVYSNGFNAGNGSITVHRDGPLNFGSDGLVRYNLSTTAVQAQAASGLKVRNYADSADAPITASNGIFTNKAAIGTSAVANAMLYISDSQPSSYPTIAIDKYTWGSPLSLSWATESSGISSTGSGPLFTHIQTITQTSLSNSPVNGAGIDARCEYDQPYVAGLYVRGRKTRTDAPTHPNLAYGIYAVANSGKASGLGGAAGYFLCETANVAGVQIRAATSQSQPTLLIQDSAATTLFQVDNTGNTTLYGYTGLNIAYGSCVIHQDGVFQIGTHAKLKRATNDLKVCAPVTYFRNYADSADAAINAGAATLTGQLKLPVDTQVISSESQNRIYFANNSHTYYAVPAGSAHVFREGSSSNRGAVEALKVTTKNNSSTTTNLLKDVGGIEAYPQGTTDAGILVTMPASSTAKALEVIMSATSNFSVSSSGVVISKFDTKAGAVVVGDLATSTIRTIKDTSGGKTRIYINDGGTLKQSMPFIADAGSTGWSISNFTTHKTLDPTTTTMTELINFIATLAQRLKDLGAIDA